MRVVLLGAGGFIASRLAAQLGADGALAGRRIDELVLVDQRGVSAVAETACTVTPMQGDVRDTALREAIFSRPVDVVIHLAATLTLDAESDFRRGLETNLLALVGLLEHCRAQAVAPMVLFASSISTFGGTLPEVVDDDLFQAPTTSYGTHKAIAELLLADYSRHGFIDGRALRLPIVLTHPGPASGSISDQVAALIREPLRGRATCCRIAPDSRIVVASVDNVVRSFIRLAALPADRLQHGARVMNLPGLSVTPAQIVAAVDAREPGAAERVQWQADLAVQRVIDGWPKAFTSRRARALGFAADESVDAIVAGFDPGPRPGR